MIKRQFLCSGILAFVLGGMGKMARAEDAVYSAAASSTPIHLDTASLPSPGVPAVVVPAEAFQSPLGKAKSRILSGFGQRNPPGTNKLEKHEGVDYRIEPGAAVRAAKSGRILFAGFSTMYVSRSDKTDKSRLIIIQHADGTSTRYVHLNTLKVQPRQTVKAGQVIGTAAESDEWKEPVLHFEIRKANGKALDPEDALNERK